MYRDGRSGGRAPAVIEQEGNGGDAQNLYLIGKDK